MLDGGGLTQRMLNNIYSQTNEYSSSQREKQSVAYSIVFLLVLRCTLSFVNYHFSSGMLVIC